MPRVEVLLTEDAPSPRNPLGIKGAGEAGTNGAGAAIAAAIDQAISMPGAVTQLPRYAATIESHFGKATKRSDDKLLSAEA